MADAEVQIVRCEERREVAEVREETEDSAGDRLSHVAEEVDARSRLSALLLSDLQRNLLLLDRDGPRSPRFIDSHTHTHSFARVITDDTCLEPNLFIYFSGLCPGPSSICLKIWGLPRGAHRLQET